MNGTVGFLYDGNVNGSANRDRLTQESSTRFSGFTENNACDSAGNPTTFRNSSGISYNGNNQRTGTGYAYDGNGNPTTYSSGSASYDEENRLTAFPSGSAVWGAGYRSDGLRAWTRKSASGAKMYSYYDGGNTVLETKSDGTIVGMNIFAPDGLVTRWSKLSGTIPVVGDYQFDWQGNAVHCLFSGARYSDEPLIHSAYDAWGQRNFVYSNGASSAADLLRFGYNARWGYKLDTETGLYYCQHRYYDPQNGRWLTRDPMRYGFGLNIYSYCGTSPVLRIDPHGFSWLDTIKKNIAAVACLTSLLWTLLTDTPNGDGNYALCKSIGSCVGTIAGAVVADIGGPIGACLSGLASAAVSSIIDEAICKPIFCDHPKPPNWPCIIAKAAVALIAGCIGAYHKDDPITKDIENWIISLIGKAGGNIGRSGCEFLQA